MEYKIPVNKDNVYKAVLTVVNFNLGLSDMEIDILATLLKYRLYLIDTTARDVIRKVLNKSKFSTNNYIKRLKEKNIIVQEEETKKLYLNPGLREIINSNEITFKFDITDDIRN